MIFFIKKTGFLWLNLFFFISSFAQNNQISNASFDELAIYEMIAFGEASHGSQSDYIARENLIESLLKHHDTVLVIVEMPYYGGIAIEQYRNGQIERDDLLKELIYYGLCTNSFLHLIDKFKQNRRIVYFGIDMQTHLSVLNLLQNYLMKSNPDFDNEISININNLRFDFLADFSSEQYSKYSNTIDSSLQYLERIVTATETNSRTSFIEKDLPFIIIKQYFGYVKGLKIQKPSQHFYYSHYRDSCMAENTISIKNQFNKKILILAANSHVIKSGSDNFQMMGRRLETKLQGKYFVIVSQYASGEILENYVSDGSRKTLVKSVRLLKRTLPSKLDKLLKVENDTLIMIDKTMGRIQNILNRDCWYQDFGAGRSKSKRSDYYYGTPAKLFDAIYFIPNVKPSEAL